MGITSPETETEEKVEQITKKKLMEDLKTVVIDAEGLLKKAASDPTREWIRKAQSKAEKSLKAASDWLTEEEESAIARARSAAKATENYVRTNSCMVLGMAAISGFVIGILAVRRGLSLIKAGEKAGDSR